LVASAAGFIFLGAALIERFAWVFYIFGLVLLVTAGHTLLPEEKRRPGHDEEGAVLRMTRKLIPTTATYATASR